MRSPSKQLTRPVVPLPLECHGRNFQATDVHNPRSLHGLAWETAEITSRLALVLLCTYHLFFFSVFHPHSYVYMLRILVCDTSLRLTFLTLPIPSRHPLWTPLYFFSDLHTTCPWSLVYLSGSPYPCSHLFILVAQTGNTTSTTSTASPDLGMSR